MKVYVQGPGPSIRVPAREIALTDGTAHTVYDTSGPASDPQYTVDIRRGLPPLRSEWIEARSDTLRLEKPTSVYRRGREAMPQLDEIRFPQRAPVRRAKPGGNVTQMHYARRGE